MSKTVYIYCLKDPRTMEIRYIGQAVNTSSRLSKHISHAAKNIDMNYKGNWIRELLSLKTRPLIEILYSCDQRDADLCEINTIASYKKSGARLTNISPGGANGSGWKLTPEQISKFSKKLRGVKKSEEHRKNLSKAKMGIKPTEETRKKMSIARKGKRPSSEAIEKTRRHHIGKKRSIETIMKQKQKWDERRTSKFPKGVRKEGSKFGATVCAFGKKTWLGSFNTIEEASNKVLEYEKNLIAEYGRRIEA